MATEEHDIQPARNASLERHRGFFVRNSASHAADPEDVEDGEIDKGRPTKWSMGVLNDPTTHEVPGSVLLLTGQRNEPLGLRNAPARTSASSLPAYPSPAPSSRRQSRQNDSKKKTPDGAIILEPQPDDSINDPLNWPTWRRDTALLSLGLYCMVGGGMTPILAAGFTNVAATYDVTTAQVALTTGLYMMGLGVGSVIASPTAILYGKRPVYLVSAIIFMATSVWCATSPSYTSLLLARIFQGMSVSPVECLPSASIAEIFFLHERAYRIGIYTLLLLGGKNLVPLVSAAIIQSYGWRWVFWIVTMVVGFCGVLLFFFVPESFWDRTPVPKSRKPSHHKNMSRPSFFSLHSFRRASHPQHDGSTDNTDMKDEVQDKLSTSKETTLAAPQRPIMSRLSTARRLRVGFVGDENHTDEGQLSQPAKDGQQPFSTDGASARRPIPPMLVAGGPLALEPATPLAHHPRTPALHNFNSPYYSRDLEREDGYFNNIDTPSHIPNNDGATTSVGQPKRGRYMNTLKTGPKLTFTQQLRPFNGRLHYDNWLKVAIRPFILFAYPSVLWSAGVYACSVGWLIVLSESVAVIFRSKTTYGFSALSTGLIYISPFIGGVLGTAVAGKVSDIIVRFMAKRNGGLYEPEFRLVMAAPVAITTVVGLMGFGWSAKVHDTWIVPTIFFGVISFGCSLGSTTAITFCVDSYRQYAGEALVTLNFAKNIFHGLVFSLFFSNWLLKDGSKSVFIWVGIIQLVLMAFTIPMYIFGKRARMWTARRNLMERF